MEKLPIKKLSSLPRRSEGNEIISTVLKEGIQKQNLSNVEYNVHNIILNAKVDFCFQEYGIDFSLFLLLSIT